MSKPTTVASVTKAAAAQPREDFHVHAPGRVNLIGEHTDYNDGYVLPMAIERGITATVRRRDDGQIVLRSDADAAVAALDPATLRPGRTDWARYPAGVIAGYRDLGWTIPGFEARYTADLPLGGGLSSSAALEVVTATAIEALCARSLEPTDRALLCQRAEHEFAGVPCGIMDQFAVTCARAGHALLLDCRSHAVRHVRFAEPEVAVLVIDSGVQRRLADGAYARRRAECESAARLLGRSSLRDVTEDDWLRLRATLPEPERARAAHVLSENARALALAAALERRDWPAAGALLRAGHASLAGDFEVSCRELDLLCEIAGTLPGVHGCRMTGGGFGGCAVALVETARTDEIMSGFHDRYRAATGIDAAMFVTRAAGGPTVEPL